MRPDGAVVLVVEDEEDSRETLKEILEFHGFKVQVAANGAEALERLDALRGYPCLVLLDLYMPVMDGWQVVDRLRTEGRLTEVHLVLTTSSPHKAPSDLPVLAKPLELDKLLATVRAFC